MRCAETNPSVLVIGYGNPLRGDDGVGWRAVELLAAQAHEPRLTTIAAHQLMPEHAGPVSKAGLVIFIDASVSDAPGEIACKALEPGSESSRSFTHSFGPGRLLEVAEQTYGSAGRAFLFTVGGEFFGYGERVSKRVEEALPDLLARVTHLVEWWACERSECVPADVEAAQHA